MAPCWPMPAASFLRVPDEVREQAAEAHPELGDYFNKALPS